VGRRSDHGSLIALIGVLVGADARAQHRPLERYQRTLSIIRQGVPESFFELMIAATV
jgi:hypothetical protein